MYLSIYFYFENGFRLRALNTVQETVLNFQHVTLRMRIGVTCRLFISIGIGGGVGTCLA